MCRQCQTINTSCGPDLDPPLQGSSEESFMKIVPWPADKDLIGCQGMKGMCIVLKSIHTQECI